MTIYFPKVLSQQFNGIIWCLLNFLSRFFPLVALFGNFFLNWKKKSEIIVEDFSTLDHLHVFSSLINLYFYMELWNTEQDAMLKNVLIKQATE